MMTERRRLDGAGGPVSTTMDDLGIWTAGPRGQRTAYFTGRSVGATVHRVSNNPGNRSVYPLSLTMPRYV